MPVRRWSFVFASLVAAGVALSGCAAPGTPGAAQAANDDFNDPYENTNREVFAFNQTIDEYALVPVAKAYRTAVPTPVQLTMRDFLRNLNGPVIFANDVLQADPKLAGTTLARVALNTTFGLGGLFDVASQMGLPYHTNDLGVTLAAWGVGEGPYVVVPLVGPSNPRDIVGKVGDGFADPINIAAGNAHMIWIGVVRRAGEVVDWRARNIESLDQIEKTSLDYYATIRSLYRQQRQVELRHGDFVLPGAAPTSDTKPEPAMSYTVSPSLKPAGAPAR